MSDIIAPWTSATRRKTLTGEPPLCRRPTRLASTWHVRARLREAPHRRPCCVTDSSGLFQLPSRGCAPPTGRCVSLPRFAEAVRFHALGCPSLPSGVFPYDPPVASVTLVKPWTCI
jgi:hypothetical protein